MNELVEKARAALYRQDGRQALEWADKALEQDEGCSEAWLIAMQSFQLFLPIDSYDPQNEVRCARYAIRFAPANEKSRVRRQVYTFLLNKVLEVLERDAQILSDGRELVSFYQRISYFNASGAPDKAREHDAPLMQAAEKSFAFCSTLFTAVPPSAIKRSRTLENWQNRLRSSGKRHTAFFPCAWGLSAVK